MKLSSGIKTTVKLRMKAIISSLAVVLLAGCSFSGAENKYSPVLLSPYPQPQITGTTSIPPTATEAAISHSTSTPMPPTATPVVPATTQYALEATLDFVQHTLSVGERIRYVNQSADDLRDIVLIVEPNLIPSGFSLDSISWEDGTPISQYSLEKHQMQIPLRQTLRPSETLILDIHYTLELPLLSSYPYSGAPVAYGYSARQTNLVDWYLYIPPYMEGTGWLVHKPWAFGEYQVLDVADFDVAVNLAEPVADLVLAASSPAVQEGNRYVYHLDNARAFAISASTEYMVQTTTIGEVTLLSYAFPFDHNAGQEALNNTADALQLFSSLIIPYGRATLSIVEADFLDGMEYDGLFFLSHGFYDLYDGTPKGYLTFIAAHETAHQWWYSLVGNDQAVNPWLDEALCTYMELVYYQNIYSDYPLQSGGSLVDWWWYYRVNFYEPYGFVGGSIYDYETTRAYRDAVYLNGAIFLDNVRKLIGDQAFFAFLRDYASDNAYRIANPQIFLTTLKAHTSENLDSLIASYFDMNP